MKMRLWTMAAAALLPALAQAQDAPANATDGAAARTWVDLQTSNSAGSAEPRPMPGEVANQVYDRYLKSFSHPIPEQFERDKFVSGGGGGGSR